MTDGNRVRVVEFRTSSDVTGSRRALRKARRAAGSKCRDGVRPGTLVLFGAARGDVIAELADAGYTIEIIEGTAPGRQQGNPQ